MSWTSFYVPDAMNLLGLSLKSRVNVSTFVLTIEWNICLERIHILVNDQVMICFNILYN